MSEEKAEMKRLSSSTMTTRSTLHVEVVQKDTSRVTAKFLESLVRQFLEVQVPFVHEHIRITQNFSEELALHIDEIALGDDLTDYSVAYLNRCDLAIHIFKLDRIGGQTEVMEEAEDETAAATNWILPSKDLQGHWENLIFDDDVKNKLISFVQTAILFSDHGVDVNKISWNRVVLLHGPPGTGKTSLCRALAQKLAIRLHDRYAYGQLLEINSHSLFSKWFSESGKLVQKMFETIHELVVDNPSALICVLIDEVESLASARKSGGNEPSDATRVVNALLTQIDAIKNYPNVVILTTSNITGSIDMAFVDRADIKHYIGLPSTSAIYSMLYSSIEELRAKRILKQSSKLLNLTAFRVTVKNGEETTSPDEEILEAKKFSSELWRLSELCKGLSGRTLRKLPFLAIASLFMTDHNQFDLSVFLQSLEKVIHEKHDEAKKLME